MCLESSSVYYKYTEIECISISIRRERWRGARGELEEALRDQTEESERRIPQQTLRAIGRIEEEAGCCELLRAHIGYVAPSNDSVQHSEYAHDLHVCDNAFCLVY